MKKLSNKLTSDNALISTLKMSKLEIQFYAGRITTPPPPASSTFLPVMMYMCPPTFDTAMYFDVSFTILHFMHI